MAMMASPTISDQSQTGAESVEGDAKKQCHERMCADHNLCPFKLQWSFGLNPNVPVINLTTEKRTLIAYACSHVALMYNYASQRVLPLLGHRNAVETLSTTRDGKWLLTADFEEDSAVVIWDTEKGQTFFSEITFHSLRIPVCTLFNPHGNGGLTAARISPDARHIVTVGNEKCQNVHFWLWTHGKDKPDASVSLINTPSERVKEVTFNNERTEQFALTTDCNVVFLTWNGHALNCDYPKVAKKLRRIGIFNGSCYVSKTQQVLTGTTDGYILVWENVSSVKPTVDDLDCQRKRHIQTINLQKSSINVIADNGGKLVMGSSNGHVTFYDYQFKLLYWCENRDLDSVRWISFNLRSNLTAPMFSVDKSERHQHDGKTQMSTVSRKLDAISAACFPPFNFQNFLACSSAGVIALIQMPEKKFHLVLPHPVANVTSIDAYPESNYLIVGDARGSVRFYNYETRTLITSKSTPPLPDFLPILEKQAAEDDIVYVTCPQRHESLKAVTALTFSPKCDLVVCGLENGAMWILHHITLDPLDEIPYKHSSAAISKIAFGRCSEYMAYADDALTVVVFRRNDDTSRENMWNLIGKYHSHRLPVRDVLFGPAQPDSDVPQLFSLGEDRELVEYDLRHSGPYPVPGLQILRIRQIEQSAVPLCLEYLKSDIEGFLVVANSEYKYKIFCDSPSKAIRGTYLGPTYGGPVQHFQVLTNLEDEKSYMVFATDREIGLQLLPVDGNPYKIVAVTGHSQKITGLSVSHDRQTLFTMGRDDPCVLMWKINFRSVDVMAQLGGERLSPFYCLIEGGKKGCLMNEMKDMFNYAKILHQGEYTTAPRVISDTVVVEQIPNLMRAVGYFPSNEEIENMLTEVCYKHYVKTGKIVEEITFEEFVRLYVNHRPAFGISVRRAREAFRAFAEEDSEEIPTLTRKRFVQVLLGEVIPGTEIKSNPLTFKEIHEYLKLLMCGDDKPIETGPPSRKSNDFRFLPPTISYRDFTVGIMGVELEEARTDN